MSGYIDIDFFVRPLEPVLFGEPRPFNAGESHLARSQFPPSPQTFQGLVRSHLLRSTREDLNDWSAQARERRRGLVGAPDALPPDWQLSGPLPARIQGREPRLMPWAPAPRFLYRAQSPRSAPRHAEILHSDLPAMDDTGTGGKNRTLVGVKGAAGVKTLGGWLSADNLLWALGGGRHGSWSGDEHAKTGLPSFVEHQRQTGIGLNRKSNTAEDRMLYTLEGLRFAEDAGFWAGFSGTLPGEIGDDALHQGVSSGGRKARLMAFQRPPDLAGSWRRLLRGEQLEGADLGEGGTFWLYLLTPARLQTPVPGEQGLLDTLVLHQALPPGVSLEPLAALTGPPLAIGGWNLAERRMRPNRAFVPAGSCLLFRLQGGDAEARRQALRSINNSHCLGERNEAAFGFGHVLVGVGPSHPDFQGIPA